MQRFYKKKVEPIMESTISFLQILLAIFATAAGLLRLLTPYARFVQLPAQGWAKDFKPMQVKVIGLLELLAGAGLILPLFFPALSMLAPLAALGLALVMAGAMATHLRRDEYINMVGNLVWLALALFFVYDTIVVNTAWVSG